MQGQQQGTRAAENETLFREVNDRVKQLNEAFEPLVPFGEWACECPRIDCIQQSRMTLEEYEALRSSPNRFAVAPGAAHVDPEVERVVERTERFWIVEKIGAAGERVRELDRRRG